jgi:hypothetical protein
MQRDSGVLACKIQSLTVGTVVLHAYLRWHSDARAT